MAERIHCWIEKWLECRPIYLSIDPSIYWQEAILRDLLKKWMCTAPNWSNSATPPGKMEGHSSKTTNSCEASSIFEVDNMNKEAILRDFLQKCKDECRADGLVEMHFAIFPPHLPKVLPRPRKKQGQVIRSAAPVKLNYLANLKIWCSRMQPLSGTSQHLW